MRTTTTPSPTIAQRIDTLRASQREMRSLATSAHRRGDSQQGRSCAMRSITLREWARALEQEHS